MRRIAAVIDVAAVVVFVVIGRSAHHHGETAVGIVSTSWPFLVGLLAGWVILRARGSEGASVRQGVVPWLATVTVGMILRVVAGQGTAVAFIIVALCFLGATMLGGRLVASALRRRGRSPSPAG